MKREDLDMLLLQRYAVEWVWIFVTAIVLGAVAALIAWPWF